MRELLLLICCAVISESAPQSIRAVDWKNFSYPFGMSEELRWMPPDSNESASLANGRYVVPDGCSDDKRLCPTVSFDSVTYGALTGIQSTVAVVVLTYHTGGTENWQYVYTFALESGKPQLLAWLESGSRADRGLREVSTTGGDLVLVVNDPDWRQGDCCSAGSITTRYRWVRSSFVRIGRPVYKTDSPSFDCAKATTAVERLVCRDGELSYLDRQMAYSYQTALEAASEERKAIIRRQQEEWFAEYSRTCNASPETRRRDCINRHLTDRLTFWK